jgi:Xaa-Pro aminopeptidase
MLDRLILVMFFGKQAMAPESWSGTVPACSGNVQELLDDADFDGEVVGADAIVSALRGQRSPTELERIETAATRTEALLSEMQAAWTPDWTEATVAGFLHDRMDEEGFGSAWSWDYCPTVMAGPETPIGHVGPTDIVTEPGHLLAIDFGVRQNAYTQTCSGRFTFSATARPRHPPR